MATQTVAYEEYAPTLSTAGVTKTYCDSVTIAEKPSGNPTPDITKAKAEAAIAKLADVEANNGYTQIAQDVGLTQSQVKKLHREFLLSKNPPEIVEEKEPVVEEPIAK